MNFFRRKPFPAKPAGDTLAQVMADADAMERADLLKAAEPEFMTPRVDIEHVPVSINMQELAAAIIRNPAFDTIVRRLRSDQLKVIVSTQPAEIEMRESAAARIRALDEIVLQLGALGVPESKVHQTRATKR